MPPLTHISCATCQTIFTSTRYLSAGLPKHCSAACRAIVSANSMRRVVAMTGEANRQRMLTNNPMRNEKTRLAVSLALKAIGHRPHVRGGNGQGPTRHEKLIADALGWSVGLVVPTRVKREKGGFPCHYKIDVGNLELQVAIEIDGSSHNCPARRKQDAKKTAFLVSRGWTVLRFTNKAVDRDLTACVQEVLSTISKLKPTTTSSPTVI